MSYDSDSPYIDVQEYKDGELKWVRKRNPRYVDSNPYGVVAIIALPFYWFYALIHGVANPHSRPTYLRWGAILLFLTLGVPLLFGLGSLVVVTILKPHMMLSHLPGLWAAIQHALY